MKKSKIILSLMLGGMLIFNGVSANALVTNNGNNVIARYELYQLDLTKYGYKSCGDNVYYRYDRNYKTLIIMGSGKVTDVNGILKYADSMKLLLIKGNINFNDDFSKMFDNYDITKTLDLGSEKKVIGVGSNFDISIFDCQSTKNNIDKFLKGKLTYSVQYGYIKDENKQHLMYSNIENIEDCRGLLGFYIGINDSIVGYAGCKAYIEPCIKEILDENNNTTSTPDNKVTTPTLISTTTINNNDNINNQLDNNTSNKEDNKKNDISATSTTTETPINTTSTVSTATVTTQDNSQKDTGDAKGILAILTLGLGSLVSVMKFKKEN